MKNGLALPSEPAESYRITATLPESGNSPQYRIRNDQERHERVITEDRLEEFRNPAGEKSFFRK